MPHCCAMTRIVVVGDTHIRTWDQAPPELRALLREADIAVHCGDWTGVEAVEGFREEMRQPVVVFGNSDPVELRRALPLREVIEVDGLRIGVTHPSWGQVEPTLEALMRDFPEAEVGRLDIVCYGHIHVPRSEVWDGIHFVNGGQGYPSFMVPGTYAVIETAPDRTFRVSLEEFAPAR